MMKQFVAALSLIALVAGPVSAYATTVSASNVTTRLEQDGGTPQASAPIVAAKWEMDGPMVNMTGTDEQTVASAQFAPSAQCGVNKTVSICGIVTDPNGKNDIKNVYGDVYYPEAVKLGASHVDPVTGQKREVGTCGEMVRECTMTKITDKAKTIDLFCNKIKNLNNNLPVFGQGYTYANICDDAQGGLLPKETAYMYCCDFTMSYEDPSGIYNVNVWANDTSDYNSQILNNKMTYLESKAFDVDFTGIDYGKVKTGLWQEVAGNTTWAMTPAVNGASVRNCSSTRIKMGVWQDDMGIKDPDGTDYVKFKAAVSSAANYQEYENNLMNTDGTHKVTW
ncbi:MAG: hypothetical protein MUD10_04580, partial [Candidatus Pacebacteria bacterium]|nr:hypothetical protein [Candidatus Paceibacterota bacterium]